MHAGVRREVLFHVTEKGSTDLPSTEKRVHIHIYTQNRVVYKIEAKKGRGVPGMIPNKNGLSVQGRFLERRFRAVLRRGGPEKRVGCRAHTGRSGRRPQNAIWRRF